MYISCAALGKHLDDELEMYRRIARGPESHPGRQAIRSVLDSFHVDGIDEQHRCLVHHPLGDNLSDFLRRNPVRRLPTPILAFVLHRLFRLWTICTENATSFTRVLLSFLPSFPVLRDAMC